MTEPRTNADKSNRESSGLLDYESATRPPITAWTKILFTYALFQLLSAMAMMLPVRIPFFAGMLLPVAACWMAPFGFFASILNLTTHLAGEPRPRGTWMVITAAAICTFLPITMSVILVTYNR